MSNKNGSSRRLDLLHGGAMPSLEQILRKRRILITGATGFLGKVLLYLLLRDHPEIERIFLLIRGDRKSSLSRLRREILDSPALAPLRERRGASFDNFIEDHVTVAPGDISQPALISEADQILGNERLDAVIHCAG